MVNVLQEERVRDVILYTKFLEAVRFKFFEIKDLDISMKKLIWNKISKRRKTGDPIGGNNTSRIWKYFKNEVSPKKQFSETDVIDLVSKIHLRLVA